MITNSVEVTANMNPWELRTTLNEVNAAPKPPPEHIAIINNYTFKRDVEYTGMMHIYKYRICKDGSTIAVFSNMQYPSCCGISILFNFNSIYELPDEFDDILFRFFQLTNSQWKPNIQFVAVKSAMREEEYDEDDDEYYDKVVGIEENYDYHNFIVKLQQVLKPTLINSFINKNSDNQCDVYQAVNPFRE